jgi:phytoene/squalene synthetase
MKQLFDTVSIQSSRFTTRMYSTSFYLGVRCLGRELRDPIHSIYGFVRFADEIVDSFHGYDKKGLLEQYREETHRAIDQRISLNPILNSFQATVNRYGIRKELIDRFLDSMEMDLEQKSHNLSTFDEYILGSAEVVGLMCLRVFCDRHVQLYLKLTPHAMSLGAAFQKVNFLRDLKYDYAGLGRAYFPGLDPEHFDYSAKRRIEEDIQKDFDHAFEGIKKLPRAAQFGVYVAYVYYLALFEKIKNTPPHQIFQRRIRIPNSWKMWLLTQSYVRHRVGKVWA